MKSFILSTVAAATFALSAGIALAGPADYQTGTDNGFAVYMQDRTVPTDRAYLSGSNYQTGTDNGFAAFQQDQRVSAHRAFLSGSESYQTGTDNGFAVYLDDLHRTGH